MKNPAFYKGAFYMTVRSRTASQTFRSLCAFKVRQRWNKGSKQSVHSFTSFRSTSLHFIPLIRSHTVCIKLESSHGGLFVSSQASNASTVRRTLLRDSFAYPSLRASASFRRWAFIARVMAEKAARCLHQGMSVLEAPQLVQIVRNLKLRARKKCSPFPP